MKHVNGNNGYKVTGPNGNSIFLPAAGVRGGDTLRDDGVSGLYWSSAPDEGDTDDAFSLYFSPFEPSVNRSPRGGGRSVRPVLEN